ncbi:MAG: radical SAM protein [Bacteroidia bacterium]|nr:radical SAM protein [Bacteroidia bacterium]
MIFPISEINQKGPVVLISQTIQFSVPFSFAYLAGYLKEQGEPVKILFRPADPNDFSEFIQEIKKIDPVLVGFGSLYPELNDIKKIIGLLKDSGCKFPIVIGGQMVTPTPEFAVKITDADIGVIGEGEIILHELVRALRNGENILSIKGLAVNTGERIILTGSGKFIEDLSTLPPIPYELFPEDWIMIGKWHAEHYPLPFYRYNDRIITVHGGRGCPFRCNFCYHHSKPRYRPISIIMAEAKDALERFDGNMLDFSDDLVLATPQRARQLVNEIRSWDKIISYRVSTRFDILTRMDDNLLKDLKDSGCRVISLGVESGSNRMLKIIGKNTTSENILIQLDKLKKVGILVNLSIMVGQYTETKEDVEASILLMQKSVRNNPNLTYHFMITTPFPGSELYDILFKEGLIQSHEEFFNKYFTKITEKNKWALTFNLSAMTETEVMTMYSLINKQYAKEKRENINLIALGIEYTQPKIGTLNEFINKKIFLMYSDNSVMKSIKNGYTMIYDCIQNSLDNTRLKLRGII